MIANRSFTTIGLAAFKSQHYVALFNMVKVYPEFFDCFGRYLFSSGSYPYVVNLRTPCCLVTATLDSHHDMLTVNEIFCRNDYKATSSVKCVVDIGSNIGISALYFLTRNESSRVYLFEPNPRNLVRLSANLRGREPRFELNPVAVTESDGEVDFGIESTGRYGGVGVLTGSQLRVRSVGINSLLRRIIEKEGSIDILKLDIEGLEIQTVKIIEPELRSKIRRIYMEAEPKERLFDSGFKQIQYGTVCQLLNERFTD